MPAPPYIEFKNVSKSFGKHLVLNNMSMSVPFGEITGIIGASGSGKTTILNLLIGFYKQTSGKIMFQSREILKDIKNVNTIFGFATQGGSFYGELNVEENLKYFGKLYSLKSKAINDRITELLRLLELEEARKFLGKNLSAGMQRRLDIACALIHSPKVLILDEPTEDLDPLLRKEIIKTLKKIRDTGTTIILTSHLLGEIETLCENIGILNCGRIVKFDSPSNLKKLYGKNSLDDVFESVIKETNKYVTKTLVSSALETAENMSSKQKPEIRKTEKSPPNEIQKKNLPSKSNKYEKPFWWRKK